MNRISGSRNSKIEVARSMNDMMKIAAIRAAVYMTEQACPYDEEFDGNDFCAMHLIGTINGEPAGCLRVRFFADFAKVERFAVRQAFRTSTLAFDLVRTAIQIARKKGFRRIYGHAGDRLVAFWRRLGAVPLGPERQLSFSDFNYTEMVLEMEPDPEAICLGSDPYVMLRPEGEWDRPGILEKSASRPVTSPLRELAA